MLAPEHIQALFLTFKLAAVTASLLLFICIPLAWWLSRKKSFLRDLINVLSALPIVLPATVLGFYLLVILGPSGLDLKFLLFSFEGLLLASIIYSFPFVLYIGKWCLLHHFFSNKNKNSGSSKQHDADTGYSSINT